MAYNRDVENDLVWDEGSGQYVPAVQQYTLTVVPTPNDATVVLTATGFVQVGNSITVDSGTSVSYSISKTGYITKSDSIVITDRDIDYPVRIWPIDNALHLQLLRGTNAENLDYTGTLGELTMDTDLNQIRLHDGETVGGHVIGADNGDSDHGVSLFDTKWVDHILNDECWLRTETFSWQDGNMYKLAYNHLVADIDGITPTTETVQNISISFYQAEDGHKIIMPNQESYAVAIFEAVGVAWYYILDTENQRFKLPRASNPGTAWYMPLSVAVSEYGANEQYLYMYIGNYTAAPSDNTMAILNELNGKLDNIHNNGTVTVNQGNTQVGQFSLNQNENVTLNLQGIPNLPASTEDDYTRVVRVGKNGIYELGAEQYTPNLFDYKRSDYVLNDPSWLCADTFSWQNGNMYHAAYDHLCEDIRTNIVTSIEGTLSTVLLSGPWYRKSMLDIGEFYLWENEDGNTVATNSSNPAVDDIIISGNYASENNTWAEAVTASTAANMIGTVTNITTVTGAVQKQEYLKHNIATLTGNTIVSNDGYLSGFSGTIGYGQINSVYSPTSSFELVVKIHTPSSIFGYGSGSSFITTGVNYHGFIIRLMSTTNVRMWASSNGTSWNLISSKDHTCDVPYDADRWFKFTWDGTTYTLWISNDGINYTSIGTTASTNPLYLADNLLNFGACSWENYPLHGGTIDLKESYIKIDNNLVWQGADYITYYETIDKHKVVLANQESNVEYLYNKTGDGWYYILDQTNGRFKLPRKKDRILVTSGIEKGIWYRLYSDGWVEQGGLDLYYYTSGWSGQDYFGFAVPMRDINYSIEWQNGWTGYVDHDSVVMAKYTNGFKMSQKVNYDKQRQANWEVRGYSAIDMSRYNAAEKRLYFYMGNFRKTALENSAGINMEILNNKVDIDQLQNYVILSEFQAPTAENNYTWYKKYTNGWVEQGGLFDALSNNSGTENTVYLPIRMADTNYTAVPGLHSVTNDTGIYLFVKTKSTDSVIFMSNLAAVDLSGQNWMVCGMAASN